MRKKWLGILVASILLQFPALSFGTADGPDSIAGGDSILTEKVDITAVADNVTEITRARVEEEPVITLPEICGVSNMPNDAGDQLLIEFTLPESTEDIVTYNIYRRVVDETDGSWNLVKTIPAGEPSEFIDGYDPDFPVVPGVTYEYKASYETTSGDEFYGPEFASIEVARSEFYHTGKTRVLVAGLLFIGLIFYYFGKAQRGTEMYLRPIAGIEAIDEAIGRATEMGKPILYVPGLSGISDVATIASLTILSRVAKKVAEYQTQLMVPNRDPIVYTVAEETVKQAYAEAGQPDAYERDSVFFLTTSQFAFVAGVNGIMMRDRPATNFYLGMFWAESLILAETGSLSGAIQIAGTDAVTQLPFFITTCDYTLIGEELYAASAYLGHEPKQIGAVKGQDACKAIIMGFVTLAFVLGIIDLIAGTNALNWVCNIVTMPIVD